MYVSVQAPKKKIQDFGAVRGHCVTVNLAGFYWSMRPGLWYVRSAFSIGNAKYN